MHRVTSKLNKAFDVKGTKVVYIEVRRISNYVFVVSTEIFEWNSFYSHESPVDLHPLMLCESRDNLIDVKLESSEVLET